MFAHPRPKEAPKEDAGQMIVGKPNIRLDDTGKTIIIDQGVKTQAMPKAVWYHNDKELKTDNRISLKMPLNKGLYYPTLKIGKVKSQYGVVMHRKQNL